jgi:hypothetical protein
MKRAVLKINEVLERNPALAENLPVTPPRILDADEVAAECQVLAEYYEKLATRHRRRTNPGRANRAREFRWRNECN